MRMPRDVSGDELARLFRKLGYRITRQTGNHMRLTTSMEGEHHITIPRHKQLKIDTLNSILKDVAEHFKISKEELVHRMWGK